MSDQVQPEIPPVEQPQKTADVSLEEQTLDKAAKSAAYRDAFERKQHLDSLKQRIVVLQSKLDSREEELRYLLPRNSVLEHSCRLSQVLVRDGTVIAVIGGGMISAGGLFLENALRFVLAGGGGAFLICGLWICKILNRNTFPENLDGPKANAP